MSTTPNPVLANKVSLDIPPEDLQAAIDGIQAAVDKLTPHLVTLTTAERRRLLKAGPRTSDFVDRALFYVRELPQFKPSFVEIQEFERDVSADEVLGALERQLSALGERLRDTMAVTASEALDQAYAAYNALKAAAQRGSPDARAAVEDLAQRLGRRTGSRTVGKGEVVQRAGAGKGGTGAGTGAKVDDKAEA